MIGTVVSAVIFMSFHIFFYQPQKKEELRLQKEIKTIDLEIEKITGMIPGLRKLEKEVAREQKSASLLKRISSEEEPVQELLRLLASEAFRLDMDVISIKSKEGSKEGSKSPQEEPLYKKLTVVMNIQCPYGHLGSYLERVSDLPGLVTIDEIEIVRDKQIFPRIAAKLTLNTFASRI
ncbi:MAG: type 4a pilus biogenesis protein PilO [Desulfobacteraceae bacterium]|nr:type 4a pilus biogenesis protein PilO [Desulfobacteraceae bacterium]